MKIGVLSDTHGLLEKRVFDYFSACDEIWHAGDIGDKAVADRLSDFKLLRAVSGNIDGNDIRQVYQEELFFEVEGVKVFMTHIGGSPPRYARGIRPKLEQLAPDIFITGHSHILKIERDESLGGLLYLNPGAAGKQGFHRVKTIVRFEICEQYIRNLQVIELGKRNSIK